MSTHYSEKKDLFPLEGGCPCGLIRFQLNLAPLLVHCCSCTACQRQTGSALALNAIIESSTLQVLPSAAPTIAGSPKNPSPVPAGAMPFFAEATSASVAAANAAPAAAATTKPKPAPVCVPSQSTIGQTIVSCPACHAGLWSHYADAGPHLSYVRVGTLDKPWEIDPDVHLYTRNLKGYLSIADDKPKFEEYYEDRKALLRDDALERLRAVQPLIDEWRAGMKSALGA